ncbi:MAG: hypothetical protein JWQ42_890 [Edaphobacter sp.]|nr:hypothetical protein [Edaphobacter sp.]MCU1318775.1 hypothetical protein [Edaphobacter sp.]
MMFPAVWSNRHAVGLISVLGILLSLPVLLSLIGLPPREMVYSGIRIETGPGPHDERDIFVDKEPVDILFVGSSLMVRGVDMDYVQSELSKKLGRPARVRFVALKWQGLDMQYMLMRDFLEHRKASLVVMVMPSLALVGDSPHIQAYRWMRWGDFPRSTAGLPFSSRVSIYGAEVLGAPRVVLNYLRSNRHIHDPEVVEELGTQHEYGAVGYFGSQFVPEPRTPPAIPVENMIDQSKSNPAFVYDGPALGPYHLHWAKEIGNLTKQYGVPFAMLHIPEDTEQGRTTVPERMYWPEVMGVQAPMVGVPAATLFSHVPPQEIDNYFYDQHFNDNGKEMFTRAVTPAILEVYDKHVR